MTGINIFQIANFIIEFYQDKEERLELSKLQKLLYYIQAWYLVVFSEPLFEEDFQAWTKGPVNHAVHYRYKDYNPLLYDKQIDISVVPGHFIKMVLKSYGQYSAYELECLSRSEPPWKLARENLSIDIPSINTISKEEMKKYHMSLIKRS